MARFSTSLDFKTYLLPELVEELLHSLAAAVSPKSRSRIQEKIDALDVFSSDLSNAFGDCNIILQERELWGILYNDYLAIEISANGLVAIPSYKYDIERPEGKLILSVSRQRGLRSYQIDQNAYQAKTNYEAVDTIARFTKSPLKRSAAEIVERTNANTENQHSLTTSLITVENKLTYAAGVINAVVRHSGVELPYENKTDIHLGHEFSLILENSRLLPQAWEGIRTEAQVILALALIEKTKRNTENHVSADTLVLNDKIRQRLEEGSWPDVETSVDPQDSLCDVMHDLGARGTIVATLAGFTRDIFSECIDVFESADFLPVTPIDAVSVPSFNHFYNAYMGILDRFSESHFEPMPIGKQIVNEGYVAAAVWMYANFFNKCFASDRCPNSWMLLELQREMDEAAYPEDATDFLRFTEGAIVDKWERKAAATLQRELPFAKARIPELSSEVQARLIALDTEDELISTEIAEINATTLKMITLLYHYSNYLGQIQYEQDLCAINLKSVEFSRVQQRGEVGKELTQLKIDQEALASTIGVWELLRQNVEVLPGATEKILSAVEDREWLLMSEQARRNLEKNILSLDALRGRRPLLYGKREYDEESGHFGGVLQLLESLEDLCSVILERSLSVRPQHYVDRISELEFRQTNVDTQSAEIVSQFTHSRDLGIRGATRKYLEILEESEATPEDARAFASHMHVEQYAILRQLLEAGFSDVQSLGSEMLERACRVEARKTLDDAYLTLSRPVFDRRHDLEQRQLDLNDQRYLLKHAASELRSALVPEIKKLYELRHLQDTISRCEGVVPQTSMSEGRAEEMQPKDKGQFRRPSTSSNLQS